MIVEVYVNALIGLSVCIMRQLFRSILFANSLVWAFILAVVCLLLFGLTIILV